MLTTKMLVIFLFILMLTSTSNQHPMRLSRSIHLPHEVIFETDKTTEETGSIQMLCRDAYAEPIPINEVKFWLNQTHACDLSLRERHDFNVVEVDSYKIKFNLTRRLEGIYTCGWCVNESGVLESSPKTLTCEYNNFACYNNIIGACCSIKIIPSSMY